MQKMKQWAPYILATLVLATGCGTAPYPPRNRAQAYTWASKEGAALVSNYEATIAKVRGLNGDLRHCALDEVRISTDVMFFDSYFGFSQKEFDGRSQHDTNAVWCLYGSLLHDQTQLERAIIHTDDGGVALDMMKTRAGSVVRMYPLTSPTVPLERLSFLLYLCRASRRIPETVDRLVADNLPRWKAENRVPALLFLAEQGDLKAKKELAVWEGDEFKQLESLFRVYEKQKKPSNKEPKATP